MAHSPKFITNSRSIMSRFLLLIVASIAVLVQPSVSFASGGYSGGGGFGNGGSRSSQQRPVDQNYEVGKAIYTGRAKGEPSLEYCIVVNGEKLPVKRRSIKTYKNATYTDFASNLYRCDQPEKRIADSLTRDSLLYVVYYLNKRHKLKLRGS
jgi:hypothetical protein